PGSKSVTNRALLAAALAEGDSELSGALASDDTDVMVASLVALGGAIEVRGDPWRVAGTNGRLRAPTPPLFTRNSGTPPPFPPRPLPARGRVPGGRPGDDRRPGAHGRAADRRSDRRAGEARSELRVPRRERLSAGAHRGRRTARWRRRDRRQPLQPVRLGRAAR